MNTFQRSMSWLRDALDLEELDLPNRLATDAVVPTLDVGTALSVLRWGQWEATAGWWPIINTVRADATTLGLGGVAEPCEARVIAMSAHAGAGATTMNLYLSDQRSGGPGDGAQIAYVDPGGAGGSVRWAAGELSIFAQAGGIDVPHGSLLQAQVAGASSIRLELIVLVRPVGAGIPR